MLHGRDHELAAHRRAPGGRPCRAQRRARDHGRAGHRQDRPPRRGRAPRGRPAACCARAATSPSASCRSPACTRCSRRCSTCASASRRCRRARSAPRWRSSRPRRTTRSPSPPPCCRSSASPPRTSSCSRSSTTCSGSTPARCARSSSPRAASAPRASGSCSPRALDEDVLPGAHRAAADRARPARRRGRARDRARAGRRPDRRGVADELVRTAGGNPLALSELPRRWRGDPARRRAEPLALRLPPGSRRRARVPPPLRGPRRGRAPRAHRRRRVRVRPGRDRCSRRSSASGLGLPELEAGEAAGPAAARGAARSRFRHPLLRSLAYHAATSGARLAAHRALAEVVTDPSLRAWHLSSAGARARRGGRGRARRGGAHRARARDALGRRRGRRPRAAELSTDDERARRAARSPPRPTSPSSAAPTRRSRASTRPSALPEASARERAAHPARPRRDAQRRAAVRPRARWSTRPRTAPQEDPVRAAAPAHRGRRRRHDLRRLRRRRSRRRSAPRSSPTAGDDGDLVMFGAAARALGLVPLGRVDARPSRCSRPRCRCCSRATRCPRASEMITFAAHAARLDRALRRSPSRSSTGRSTPRARRARSAACRSRSSTRAMINDRRGRWAPALADAGEALRLARETAQPPQIAVALTLLASLEAARGQDAEARAHAEEALAIVAEHGRRRPAADLRRGRARVHGAGRRAARRGDRRTSCAPTSCGASSAAASPRSCSTTPTSSRRCCARAARTRR